MAIEKDSGLSRGFERFGVNQGMKTRWDDFDVLETGGTKVIGNPPRGSFDVGLVFAFCADRRYTKKLVELRQVLFPATFDKFRKVHVMPSDTMIRFST
jgi:hypothetical protein